MNPKSFLRNLPWNFLFAVASVAAIVATSCGGAPSFTRTSFTGSDFKTLYASLWCLAHGWSAYSFTNIAEVFHRNGVVLPDTWFGHAPVYPPFTLGLLSPLAAVSMEHAFWIVTLATSLLLGRAVFLLLRYATGLRLPLVWRAVLAALCVAPQIVSFGLVMGNVSVAVSSLTIIALLERERRSPWPAAAALALALLLKPHLAVWALVAMLLLPEPRSRAVAFRAAAAAAAFGLATGAALSLSGTLRLQCTEFAGMLHSEGSGGSMSPGSHEALPVVAQIPSFTSLVGFWTANPSVQAWVSAVVLVLLAITLAILTRRRTDRDTAPLVVAGWCAFGLLASYHRSHDAIVLLVAAPWVLHTIRRNLPHPGAWLLVAFFVALTCGFDLDQVLFWLRDASPHSLNTLLLLRQSALAALGFVTVLIAILNTSTPTATHKQRFSSAP